MYLYIKIYTNVEPDPNGPGYIEFLLPTYSKVRAAIRLTKGC